MADATSRFEANRCSMCNEEHCLFHLSIIARESDGRWHTIYRMCWECGYEVLRQIRMRPAGKPA